MTSPTPSPAAAVKGPGFPEFVVLIAPVHRAQVVGGDDPRPEVGRVVEVYASQYEDRVAVARTVEKQLRTLVESDQEILVIRVARIYELG